MTTSRKLPRWPDRKLAPSEVAVTQAPPELIDDLWAQSSDSNRTVSYQPVILGGRVLY